MKKILATSLSAICIFSFSSFCLGQTPKAREDKIDRPSKRTIFNPNRHDTSLIDDTAVNFDRVDFSSTTKFASEASKVVGTYQPNVESRDSVSVVKAAKHLLSLLNDEQKSRLLLKLDDSERSKWTNLPARPDAGGVRFGEMTEDQIKAVCELLAHVLSPQGYEKMRLIMIADDQLVSDGRKRSGIGTEYFAFVMFGEPSPTTLWSIQLDGHHIGLNVAVNGENLTIAPSFIGTQPVNYTLDDKEIKPMQHEVDAAFLLANSLTDEQFKEAVMGDKRGNLVAGPGKDKFIPRPEGVSCADFTDQQKSHLTMLIASWVGNLPKKQATVRMKEIVSEIDEMHFSWQGFRKDGSDVSYRIQSPSLLIEFAYQDLGGNPQEHLHTQYRNPKNDYGSATPINR